MIRAPSMRWSAISSKLDPEAQPALSAWATRRNVLAWLTPPAPVAGNEAAPPALDPAGLQAALLDMPIKWSGEGELGAFVSTGSTPGSGFVGRLLIVAEAGRWRVATSGRIDYQKNFDAVTRNQIRLTFEPNYKFDEHGYIFGLGQYERDRFQGFTDRYSVSAGLGYNLLEGDGRKLSIKAGPAMRITQQVDGPQEQTLSAVALADLKLRLTPNLNYSQEVSTYFDAVRRTYYTLAALDSRLSSKLKARLSYTLQHEEGAGVARNLTDTTSRLTLLYGFRPRQPVTRIIRGCIACGVSLLPSRARRNPTSAPADTFPLWPSPTALALAGCGSGKSAAATNESVSGVAQEGSPTRA
jgi:putative salt-induced outer membrane protein